MDKNTAVKGMMSEEEFLKHFAFTPEMTEDESLEHFGVKGMKWGQSKGPKMGPDGKPQKTRKELRGLNKASRQSSAAEGRAAYEKANKQRDKSIDAARSRTDSNNQAVKAAKTQYKTDKKVIGSHAAKKALNAVKEKRFNDAMLANEAKSGKEAAQAAALNVAGALLSTYAAAR